MGGAGAISNLDFELELAEGVNYRTRGAMDERGARWRHILRLLPEAREAVALDLSSPGKAAPEPAVDRLVCWGVTPRVESLAQRLCPAQRFPPFQAVRLANDKRTSHGIELELGLSLPFSRVVSELEELEEAIALCPYGWVLKHPFGFSALERVVGKPGILSPQRGLDS